MRRPVEILLLALCCLWFISCDSQKDTSFCGFTFGGGGNTYSAEPATISLKGPDATLTAGRANSAVTVQLSWEPSKSERGEVIELSKAKVFVADKATKNSLDKGHVVLQTIGKEIVHGSFDLTTKASDGRIFPVVGSFTAKIVD